MCLKLIFIFPENFSSCSCGHKSYALFPTLLSSSHVIVTHAGCSQTEAHFQLPFPSYHCISLHSLSNLLPLWLHLSSSRDVTTLMTQPGPGLSGFVIGTKGCGGRAMHCHRNPCWVRHLGLGQKETTYRGQGGRYKDKRLDKDISRNQCPKRQKKRNLIPIPDTGKGRVQKSTGL